MSTSISHQIKGRTKPSDTFYTPKPLIKKHLGIVKQIWDGLEHLNYPPNILDPCAGVGKDGRGYEDEIQASKWEGGDCAWPDGEAWALITSYDIQDGDELYIDDPDMGGDGELKQVGASAKFDFLDNTREKMADGAPPLITHHYDIICSNPPYSIIDKWLAQSVKQDPIIISYVLAMHAVTAARLERMNTAGYYLENMTICKVSKWYGMTALCTWVKYIPGVQGKGEDCIGYDRTAYKSV